MENTIRVERAIKKITQEDLAKELKVSRQTIHAIETGKLNPSDNLALRIARYFKKQLGEVFKVNENDYNNNSINL